jgi:hypothetical protein
LITLFLRQLTNLFRFFIKVKAARNCSIARDRARNHSQHLFIKAAKIAVVNLNVHESIGRRLKQVRDSIAVESPIYCFAFTKAKMFNHSMNLTIFTVCEYEPMKAAFGVYLFILRCDLFYYLSALLLKIISYSFYNSHSPILSLQNLLLFCFYQFVHLDIYFLRVAVLQGCVHV